MKKANSNIKDVFNSYDTCVLNIADEELDCNGTCITHVVLDGDQLLVYSGNEDLGEDFQDDDYDQVYIEDDDEVWDDIIEAILSL